MNKNPFKYGSVVQGQDFCGRSEKIAYLIDLVDVGQNIVLQGERRIGKTSLVYEMARVIGKQKSLLSIDLMEVKTVEDICQRIIRALVQLESASTVGNILKKLSHLRPTLSFNSMTGDFAVGLDTPKDFGPESITDILALIKSRNKQAPIVVFFDEFQDVLKLPDSREFLAKMRSEIQRQGDIPYIFAGSVRNKMDDIFNHPESAFFKAAIRVDVDSLDQQEYMEFLIRKFSAGKRQISDSILPEIFRLSDGVTGDIQQFCQALWSVTNPGDKINEEVIPAALELIFSREKKSYEVILAGLTANSLNVLRSLSALGGEHVTAAEFIQRSKVSNASSVKKALTSMADRKIVFKAEDRWRFTNPFFGVWLQQL